MKSGTEPRYGGSASQVPETCRGPRTRAFLAPPRPTRLPNTSVTTRTRGVKSGDVKNT